jgi:hypothetical protein
MSTAPERRTPWGWLVGTGLCGFSAIAALIALAVLVGQEEVSQGMVIGISSVLLLCLLGFFGCAGCAVWRMLERRPGG